MLRLVVWDTMAGMTRTVAAASSEPEKPRYSAEEWAKWMTETQQRLLSEPGRGELEVAAMLRSKGIGFVRQRQVGQYFIDIALESCQVAIELDDPSKDLTGCGEVSRTAFLESRGWKLVRLDSFRSLEDPSYVWSSILIAVEANGVSRKERKQPSPPRKRKEIPLESPRNCINEKCLCGCGNWLTSKQAERGWIDDSHRRSWKARVKSARGKRRLANKV